MKAAGSHIWSVEQNGGMVDGEEENQCRIAKMWINCQGGFYVSRSVNLDVRTMVSPIS